MMSHPNRVAPAAGSGGALLARGCRMPGGSAQGWKSGSGCQGSSGDTIQMAGADCITGAGVTHTFSSGNHWQGYTSSGWDDSLPADS